MRKKKKTPEVSIADDGIVKPDLSYKKKEPQKQLIDLEEVFMENRYNFDEKPSQPEPKA